VLACSTLFTSAGFGDGVAAAQFLNAIGHKIVA